MERPGKLAAITIIGLVVSNGVQAKDIVHDAEY
jgi:hypothetical protein